MAKEQCENPPSNKRWPNPKALAENPPRGHGNANYRHSHHVRQVQLSDLLEQNGSDNPNHAQKKEQMLKESYPTDADVFEWENGK